MQMRDLDTGHGALQYVVSGETAQIVAYRGADTELTVPDRIEGCAVTGIGRKAFLSSKTLRQIALPASVVRIDDWAFACCSKLHKLSLPYRRMEIGQGIFRDCFALAQIADGNAGGQERRPDDVAWLLAAVTGRLDAFYLFDLENAGSDEWFARWDSRMMDVMERADEEGFSKMLLCGEEDYGSRENNIDYYREQRRREKVRLAMLRLMHDYRLEEDVRGRLREYLLSHIKGCGTEETWKVILEEHGDELEYYRFLTGLGGVNADNFQPMLEDMGDRHAEMKAYLIRYHREAHAAEDAFAAFAL